MVKNRNIDEEQEDKLKINDETERIKQRKQWISLIIHHRLQFTYPLHTH
jgi:hypothetical protein